MKIMKPKGLNIPTKSRKKADPLAMSMRKMAGRKVTVGRMSKRMSALRASRYASRARAR